MTLRQAPDAAGAIEFPTLPPPSTIGRAPRDLPAAWSALRREADARIGRAQHAGAAAVLLALGDSLCAAQSYTAGLMVLEEAAEEAALEGSPALRARIAATRTVQARAAEAR